MLHITLSGNPRERGVIQGETFRSQIHEILELSQSMFLPSKKLKDVDVHLQRMLEYTTQHEPELIAEMEGIGEASGIPLRDIFLLNAVSAVSSLGPNCTNITIRNSVDGPLLGKTSDIGVDYPYYMLQQTTSHDGQRYIGIGWVGCVWIEVGLNEHGLVVGQSSAPIAPNQDGFGIPTLVFPRPLLNNCRTVEDAIEYSQARKMAGKGLNIMLLDQHGSSAVIEKSGSYQQIRQTDSAPLFCTNHFVTNEMKDFKDFRVGGIRENSQSRFDFLSGGALEHPEDMNIATLQKLLGSHEGSICQHNGPSLDTHYAYVIAPQQQLFTMTDGHPCEHEFKAYRINE
jgi:predicted choloylglycine hydrolase